MSNKKRISACILAAAMFATNIATSFDVIRAENDPAAEPETELTDEEIAEAAAALDGVEILEMPEENGEYVVYMEADSADDIVIGDDAWEIAKEAPEVVVETDLTRAQAEELEQLSSQSGEVYIEENFFLEGAAADFDPMLDMEEDYSFLEDMEVMERYNWKKAFAAQDLDTDEEPEWNIQMVHADGGAEECIGEPVKVAVMDSGVEFLAGIPVEKSINLVKDEQELAYYMNDMTGHGTAIADIIHRICPQSQIYSVKVMDKDNRGRLSDIVAGIYWCIEQDVDIINMSFGTSKKSDILEQAIQAAEEKGILIVSSAGNGGTGSAVEYPAAFDEVIAVGAVDTVAEKTEESATGNEVELVAPGEQIAAKSLLGFETVYSGTSMAAPHVTGAAALLMQMNGHKDAAFIRRILQKSSNPLGDEAYYGSGLLDVENAKELLRECEDIVMEDGTEEPVDSAEWQPEETDADGEKQIVDALDSVVQTAKPVETFEEVDYVEGRWKTPDHGDAAQEAGNNNDFGTTAIKLFKAGAMYPDADDHNMHDGQGRYWHGSRTSNYIANYIFVTRAALTGGDVSNLAAVPGMGTTFKKIDDNGERVDEIKVYNHIKKNMNETKLFGTTWTAIMKDYAGVSGYTGQKRWRQVFIYGLAMHLATDAFAHSSWYKASDGTMKLFYHKGDKDKPNFDKNHLADETSHVGNRWKCACYTANMVAINCSARIEGDVGDFSAEGESYWKGFYMYKILEYAKAVNDGTSLSILKQWFQSMDYKSQI